MESLSQKLFKLKNTLNKMKCEIGQLRDETKPLDLTFNRQGYSSTKNLFLENHNLKTMKLKPPTQLIKKHKNNNNPRKIYEGNNFDSSKDITKYTKEIPTKINKYYNQIPKPERSFEKNRRKRNNPNNENNENININAEPNFQGINVYHSKVNPYTTPITTSSNTGFEEQAKNRSEKQRKDELFLRRLEELNNKGRQPSNQKNFLYANYTDEAQKFKANIRLEKEHKAKCYYSFDTYRINNKVNDANSMINKDSLQSEYLYSNEHYDLVLGDILKVFKMKNHSPSENRTNVINKVIKANHISKAIEKYYLIFNDFYKKNFSGYNSCWHNNKTFNQELFSFFTKKKEKKNLLKLLINKYKQLYTLIKEKTDENNSEDFEGNYQPKIKRKGTRNFANGLNGKYYNTANNKLNYSCNSRRSDNYFEKQPYITNNGNCQYATYNNSKRQIPNDQYRSKSSNYKHYYNYYE